MIDDVRAPEAVDLTWLMQSPTLARVGDGLSFVLKHADASCPMQIVQVGNDPLEPTIGVSPADNKQRPLKWQQLQLKTHAASLILVTLLKPWGGDAKLTVTGDGPVKIAIAGGGPNDVWTWTPATDRKTASTLTGRRANGFSFDLK